MLIVAIAMTLGASLSWALTGVLMKVGVHSMTRLGFAAIRPWIGLVFILPYALLLGDLELGSVRLVGIAVAGSLLNAVVGTALFYYALSHGPLHRASMLSSTGPFWGVVSSILILREPAAPMTFVAALLVVGGTYFLIERRNEAEADLKVLPLLAALGAGMLWGFASAVPAKYCLDQGMSPMAYQLLFTAGAGAIWGAVLLPKLIARRITFTRRGVIVAILSAFFGYFTGWVLWLNALRLAPASVVSPVGGTNVLFTVLLSVLILRERPTRRVAIGGVFVFAGVLLISIFG